MFLKISELSKRTGMTVRALHHYDAIGLLTPATRSDAGYRLYSRADVTRLHQIQALRRFGFALADIGKYLDRPELPFQAIVAQQITMLTQQIDQASALRSRLLQLQTQLALGQEPELSDCLITLEFMTVYEQYFSKQELETLPIHTEAATVVPAWRELVDAVRELMETGAEPSHVQAQALAQQWMTMVVRDTAANPILFAKLNAMHAQEPLVQEQTGITPEIMSFIIAAANQAKLTIYRAYLSDEEFSYVSANMGKRNHEWPPLIAQVRIAMNQGSAPDAPEVQALARHWLELFRAFAGDNPQTQQKIRHAMNTEPGLLNTTWVDATMREFMRAAITALPLAQCSLPQCSPH